MGSFRRVPSLTKRPSSDGPWPSSHLANIDRVPQSVHRTYFLQEGTGPRPLHYTVQVGRFARSSCPFFDFPWSPICTTVRIPALSLQLDFPTILTIAASGASRWSA